MLQPKRVKYRKSHKGHRRGKAQVGATVVFGDFGLQAIETVWLTSRQIEAARRAITHHIRRGGQVWIRVFPDKPVTKKAAETRRGSGQGAPDRIHRRIEAKGMQHAGWGVRVEVRANGLNHAVA